MVISNEKEVLDVLFKKYNIELKDQSFINEVISPMYTHKEFIRRTTEEFLHHDKLTLGYHILEDVIVSFLICQKKKLNRKQIKTVLLIAMMHDLYELPWQNNEAAKTRVLFHKHGFRHPIEAAINSLTWFPELFKDKRKAEIILDGIIHHMYPLPVLSINYNNYKNLEIKNIELFEKLDKEYQEMIIKSAGRKKIGCISIASTLYVEGKIMRKADKISSLDNFESISGILALVTGKNKHLK